MDGPWELSRLENGQLLKNSSWCLWAHSNNQAETDKKMKLLNSHSLTETQEQEDKVSSSPVLCSAGRTQGSHARGSRLANAPSHPPPWKLMHPAACHGQTEGSGPRGSLQKSCSYFSGQTMPSWGKRAQPANGIHVSKSAWYQLKVIHTHCLPHQPGLLYLFVPLALSIRIFLGSYNSCLFAS